LDTSDHIISLSEYSIFRIRKVLQREFRKHPQLALQTFSGDSMGNGSWTEHIRSLVPAPISTSSTGKQILQLFQR
jgi:hypothetical protein